MKKFKLLVAFSHEASDFLEEIDGDINEKIEKLRKKKGIKEGYDFVIKEFDTAKERTAYTNGLEEGNGWDEPNWEFNDKLLK